MHIMIEQLRQMSIPFAKKVGTLVGVSQFFPTRTDRHAPTNVAITCSTAKIYQIVVISPVCVRTPRRKSTYQILIEKMISFV